MLSTSMGVSWSLYRPSVRVWEGSRWQAALQSGRFYFSLLFSTTEIMMTVHKLACARSSIGYESLYQIASTPYRTMNERGYTNSLPRMNAIGPENPCGLTEWLWLDGVKKLRSFMIRSCCDLVHAWYEFDAIWYAAGVIPYSVHCTIVGTHLADFLKDYVKKGAKFHT